MGGSCQGGRAGGGTDLVLYNSFAFTLTLVMCNWLAGSQCSRLPQPPCSQVGVFLWASGATWCGEYGQPHPTGRSTIGGAHQFPRMGAWGGELWGNVSALHGSSYTYVWPPLLLGCRGGGGGACWRGVILGEHGKQPAKDIFHWGSDSLPLT